MLFMINWSIDGSNIREANERFSSGEENFYGCELIGRWHAPGNIGVLIRDSVRTIKNSKTLMKSIEIQEIFSINSVRVQVI